MFVDVVTIEIPSAIRNSCSCTLPRTAIPARIPFPISIFFSPLPVPFSHIPAHLSLLQSVPPILSSGLFFGHPCFRFSLLLLYSLAALAFFFLYRFRVWFCASLCLDPPFLYFFSFPDILSRIFHDYPLFGLFFFLFYLSFASFRIFRTRFCARPFSISLSPSLSLLTSFHASFPSFSASSCTSFYLPFFLPGRHLL